MSKQPFRIFISYSHQDVREVQDLLNYIIPNVEQAGGVFWSDRSILPGKLWDQEIRNQLEKTDIALLMVSNDFLNSQYVKNVELVHFLQQRQQKGLLIIPIILSECLIEQHEWLKETEYYPKDKPIKNQRDRTKAFATIARFLIKHLEELHKEREKSPSDAKNDETGNFIAVRRVYGKLRDKSGNEWDLNLNKIYIGRDNTCNIVINNKGISKQHACITLGEDGNVYLEDLNSRNNTRLNDQYINHKGLIRLPNHSVITLSPETEYAHIFTFEQIQPRLMEDRDTHIPKTHVTQPTQLEETNIHSVVEINEDQSDR